MTMFRPWMVAAVLVYLVHAQASAQMGNMWGSGAYMAQPNCGTEIDIGDEASDMQDELKERQRELKDAEADLRVAKSRMKSARTSLASKKSLFKRTGFDGAAFNDIDNHITAGHSRESYGDCSNVYHGASTDTWFFSEALNAAVRQPTVQEENYVQHVFTPVFHTPIYERAEAIAAAPKPKRASRFPAADIVQPEPGQTEGLDQNPPVITPAQPVVINPATPCNAEVQLRAFKNPKVFTQFVTRPGELSSGICTVTGVDSVPRGRNADSCARYLDEWIEKQQDLRHWEEEEQRLKDVVAELKELTKTQKIELKEALREFRREQREEMTEAGCASCIISGQQAYRPKRASFWDTLGNVALAGFSIYGGMQTSKYISDNNAKLGYRTDPMSLTGATMTYGYPYINAAIQGGLMGGAGNGSFACSGSAFGGNQFGPMGYGSPMGMMNPYGPMGMNNNMWGNPMSQFGSPFGNGMFNPGMGIGFQPGYGMQNYCPTWPCPVGMMNGGLQGYNPMMNGMMGMNGMNPMMPGYLTPGMSMGINPMNNMMGGYNPMMSMMGSNPMGMMNPMMGGYNPMMAGMGNMTGSSPFGNYQMMQMQQQMYQQQQAMMMQQQARAYQNQMAQQQAMSGMYSELNNLMMRINSAQMSMYSGGYSGFDSSLTPSLYNMGNNGFNTGFSNTGTLIPGTTFYNNGTNYLGTTSGVPSYR